MDEINYPSRELTAEFLHEQADTGDEEGFQYRPTQGEM
jgi:hypothetical protein